MKKTVSILIAILFVGFGFAQDEDKAKEILGYKTKRRFTSRVYPPFFFSTYFMDTICFVSDFPIMGWKWTVQNPLPIQVYHKVLWESNFIPHFFNICHGVMLPIHKILYKRDAPRFRRG